MMNTGKLAGKTVFITGASRGIGKAIALKVARDGANVVVAAKTVEPHPKLPGTIYTACEEIEEAGGRGLPCMVDVRDEKAVEKAVEEAVKKFGGIDILVNNASAISLTGTAETEMKRYDLMHGVNTRGTFLLSKTCLPYLKKSNHAHILNLSPPLSMNPLWFQNHVAYTMAKYGMSMCVLGMHEELKPFNIGVNALWPKTVISTAAIVMLKGNESHDVSRNTDIMGDSAYAILTQDPRTCTGNFFVDEDVLRKAGITDFKQYACNPENNDRLAPDYFLDENIPQIFPNKTAATHTGETRSDADGSAATEYSGEIGKIFTKIHSMLSSDGVKKTQAVFAFEITGDEKGQWFLDMKNGEGSCGQGQPPVTPDATLTLSSDNFCKMCAGNLKPAMAYMTGKLKVSGSTQQALKLENVIRQLQKS